MIFIFYYILIGLITSILLEMMIRSTGTDVFEGERIAMILLWPIMILILIFLAFSSNDDDIPPY
jgi:hypothetical protein